MKWRYGIQLKISVLVSLFVLATMAVVSVVGFLRFRDALLSMSEEYLQALTVEGAKKVEKVIEQHPDNYYDLVKKEVTDIENTFFKPKGMSGYAYIMSQDGVLLFHPKSEGLNISNEKFAQEMIANKNGIIRYVWEGRPKTVAYRTLKNGMIYAVGNYDDEFMQPIYQLRNTIIAIGFATLVVAVGVSVLAARYLVRPIYSLREGMVKTAGGDLTVQIATNRKDELGELTTAFNTMVKKIRRMLETVNNHALHVASLAEELYGASEQNSQATQDISRTVQELSTSIQQIATSMQSLSHAAFKTGGATQSGKKAVERTLEKFDEIRTAVQDLAQSIESLEDYSEKIDQINDLGANIVDQTKLLALNATIEAARAGEHGRGFAVVADEIRKLAVESSNSIQQVKQIVKTMLALMQDSVEKMNNGRRAVEEGWAAVSAAVKAFNQIADNINTTVSQVREISNLTQTMAEGAQQIAAATEEQSAAMHEISLSAQNLAESSAELQENLSHFKIKKEEKAEE